MLRGRRIMAMAILVTGLLVLGACASSSLQVAPGGGKTFSVTKHTYHQVWLAVLAAFTRNLNIVQMDKTQGVIVGNKAMWGRGQQVAVFIRPPGKKAKAYTVEVVSSVTDDPTTDWLIFMTSEIKDAL